MNDLEKFAFLQRFAAWLNENDIAEPAEADIWRFLETNR